MAQNPKAKHVDAVLTNISVKHELQEFIWPEVLASVPVNKKSDVYFKYESKERLRIIESGGIRPPKAYTREVDYRTSTAQYLCEERAFSMFVGDDEQANADAPLDPYRDAVEDVTEEWSRHAEYDTAALVFNPANYPAAQKTTLSGASRWSHADADPVKAILQGHKNMHCPRANRRLLINEDVELELLTHPSILNRLSGIKEKADLEDLAKLCRVEKVIVGYAEYDGTAKKAAAARTGMWGKHALLYYHNPRPGVKRIALGYTFVWKFYGNPTRVRKVPNPLRGSGGHDIIVEGCTTQKFVSTDCAYFFEDAVA